MPTSSAASGAARSVQAVIIRCDGEQGAGLPPWSSTTIPADHPVFWEPITPLASCLDIPIAVHREDTQPTDALANLDNQVAAYLNIKPETGMADLSWQSGVGT